MVLTWTFDVFTPTTSCKWSVCGTVTDDSWMRHRSWYVLSAYALLTLGIFALIGLRFASRCIRHCNTTAISAYGTHLPTVPTQAYAILCTPAKMPTRALLKTYSDVCKLCITRSLRRKKRSSRRLWRKKQRFHSGNVFFSFTDGGCGCGCARPERERRARPRHDLGVSRCGDRVFGSGKGLKVLVFKKEMRKQIRKIEAQDMKLIG